MNRHKLEEHAVAIMLTASGLLFGIGLILTHTGRQIDAAVAWLAPR